VTANKFARNLCLLSLLTLWFVAGITSVSVYQYHDINKSH